MPRLLIVLVPILVLVLAAACDDGDGDASPTPDTSPTADASPAADASPTGEPTDEGSPAADATVPADSTPSTDGARRITLEGSAEEFLEQFSGKRLTEEECTLDADAGEVDCGENGVYEPDPAPDADAECSALLADGELAAISCETQGTPAYYSIP